MLRWRRATATRSSAHSAVDESGVLTRPATRPWRRKWRSYLWLVWLGRLLLSLGTGNPYDGYMIRDGSEWVARGVLRAPGWVPMTLRRRPAVELALSTEPRSSADAALDQTLIDAAAARMKGILSVHGNDLETTALERGSAVLLATVLYGVPWSLVAGLARWSGVTMRRVAHWPSPQVLHLVPSLCFMQPLLALFEYVLWMRFVDGDDDEAAAEKLYCLYWGTAVLALLVWIGYATTIARGLQQPSEATRTHQQRLGRLALGFVFVACCVRPASALYTFPLLLLWARYHAHFGDAEQQMSARHMNRSLSGAVRLVSRSEYSTRLVASLFQAAKNLKVTRLGLVLTKDFWLSQLYYQYRLDFAWTTLPWMLGPSGLNLLGVILSRVLRAGSLHRKRSRALRRKTLSMRTSGPLMASERVSGVSAEQIWSESLLLVTSVGFACYSMGMERDWPSLLPICISLMMMSLASRPTLVQSMAPKGALDTLCFREAGLARVPYYLHQQGIYPAHLVYAHTDMPPRALFAGPLRTTQVHHLRSPTLAYLRHYVEADDALSDRITSDIDSYYGKCVILVVAPTRTRIAANWPQLRLCRRFLPHWSAHVDWRQQPSERISDWVGSLFTLDLYRWCGNCTWASCDCSGET
ncbi:hypothetical protein F1559_000823 [Cyanidiococcus yangmingshanensis]|uniref:Uncharacterized protein n=1 Tax=Cyanidiococcus yangmingshanensis TaxID=2690220 RepID=A0A7J7IDM4_9RHOD|nr:hypothetical protein F1559_000823 [Cyanidiococcus yangmingshanensis]